MRLFMPLSSMLLALLLIASFQGHDAQVVHAAAITTGEYLVTKLFLDSECVGTPTAIQFQPAEMLQDCLAKVKADVCQYYFDPEIQKGINCRQSCTGNLLQLMRNEYPNMDVLQEQIYTDDTCQTLAGLVISAAKPTDMAVITCTAGSTFHLINTGPVLTTNSLHDEAKARRTVRIIGIVCAAVASSLLGYLWRRCCGSSSKNKNKNKVSEETKASKSMVQPI